LGDVYKRQLKYKSLNNKEVFSKFDVTVSPATTTFFVSFTSKYAQEIQINTSPSGANIKGNVYNFPILIRLTSSNFDFSSAKENGEDIRFTKANGTLLPYEIERWKRNEYKAEIWVNVDTIYGNDSTQSIIMYWGNEAAKDSSNSMAVFDTSAGFTAVWHLSEVEGNSFIDGTLNKYNGISADTSLPSMVEGIIGESRNFDGINDFIVMPNTANSKLNFPQDGFFTVSAWVNVDTFDYVYRTILTKGFEQYFLQLSYFPGNKPLWQFSVFREEDNWNMSHAEATETKKWVFLTGVREGNTQRLYCNGELVAEVSAVYDQNTSRITTNDFSIGSFLQEATFPAKFGYCYFKGKIDEVRVCNVSRNADWIRLSYMNQKEQDRVIKFK
ncbi:MAG: DUF2341 domain-containing protein, partial [Chitinispirillaceae bacterium]|nr:DUF2341 domain-containing protein [Chitinispirillaceae bacterium]